MSVAEPILRVLDLTLDMNSARGVVHVLRGVTFEIPRGHIVGMVGESGSGKSTIALCLLGLLPANAQRPAGELLFDGIDLLSLDADRMQRLRGDRLALVFQDPMTALNPLFTIGTHLVDVIRRGHRRLSTPDARRRAADMMTRVGIPDGALRLDDYPHQLSGGMRQRIVIAMALLTRPDLLIADEPTTALDATIEAQIVALFQELRAERARSILFISHSLGLVAEISDDVVVMYAGTVVETGPVDMVFGRPRHPYTDALLQCELDDRGAPTSHELRSIPGDVPELIVVPSGCIFATRCPLAVDQCRAEIPCLRQVAPGQRAACWRA